MSAARRDPASLVDVRDLAVGPSEYNRRQLEARGFRHAGALAVDSGPLTAVPDTLGGAGVPFRPKNREQVAELLGMRGSDRDLRARIIEGPRQRRAQFQSGRVDEALGRLVGRFQ